MHFSKILQNTMPEIKISYLASSGAILQDLGGSLLTEADLSLLGLRKQPQRLGSPNKEG